MRAACWAALLYSKAYVTICLLLIAQSFMTGTPNFFVLGPYKLLNQSSRARHLT